MATFSFEEAVAPQDVQQPERVAKTFTFEEVASQATPETKTSNPLYGAFGRAAEMLGSGAEAVQRVSAPTAEGIQQALPESMRSKYLAPEAAKERQQAFTEEATKYSKDIGYAPSTSLKELGDNPLKVIPFVAERVITSAPDMAGAALAFTPYVMTRANEILNERLKNDNKTYEQATVGDVTAATTAAIAESTLERFATKRILPGGKGIAGAPAAGGAAKRIGKEVGLQSGTESAEELASYLGEAAGTEKGFSPEEAGMRMLEAGIVGGGLGGAARGGREAYDAAQRKEFSFEEAKAPEVATVEETAITPSEERAAPVEPVAPLEKPPLTELPKMRSKSGRIEGVEEIDIDPNELKLSEDVPQFKEDADVQGIVEPLKGKKYDYVGTPPIQVWRRLDGSLEIISGRHRWDLAKRTGATHIPAQVFDEAKGFNADMAAIMDAELNIRDGKGKVTDYVNYFTEAGNRFGLTKEDYAARGLLDSEKGKRAYTVTVQGSNELIQALRGRQVKEDTAYRIADAVPNDARLQALGLKLVNEKPLEQAINILHAAKTIEPKAPEQGGDLFGFDDSGLKLAEDMGKLALEKQKALSADINTIERAGKQPAIARKYGIDVKDPDAIKAKVKEMKAQRSAWDNWASDPELVDQIRRELSGEVVEPAEAKTEAVPKKPAKKEAEKAEVGKELFDFELTPEGKPADKKAAAEREQKEIADREAEFFTLTPRTPEQGAGNYLQQDMIGAMGLTEAEFKKGIDKKSTEPGEPLILRNVTMSEHDTYNDDANSKVDESINDDLSAVPNMKDVEVDEADITHTLERQAQAVEDYIELASQGKVTAKEFMESVREASANGEIAPDVFNAIEKIYKLYPNVLEGIRFEAVAGAKKTGKYREAGHYQPLARMIRLFKDTSGVLDPATVRHEIAHTMEQMMTPEQKRLIVRAWRDELLSASKAETADEGRLFFINVAKYLRSPSFSTLKALIKSMPNVSYYQYINPSEYWAVNAEKILKSSTEGAGIKSRFDKVYDGLKQAFGVSNFYTGNKVFEQILTGDRFNNRMILSYLRKTKLRNYKGKEAPLPTWDVSSGNWWDDKIYLYQDKHIDLFRVQQEIERLSNDIPDERNPHIKETLSHSRTSSRMAEFDRDYVKPLTKVMKEHGISQGQLHEFLLARHAPEYNEDVANRNPEIPDGGASITTKEAENYMRSLGEKRRGELEKAAHWVDKMTQRTRDILVENGYENPETIKAWQDKYKFYVPMFRKDIQYQQAPTNRPSSKARGKFSRARTGSTKEVDDIGKNVVLEHLRAIDKIENARVKNSLIALAANEPNPDFWFVYDPNASNKPADVKKKLEAFGCSPDVIENFMKAPNVGRINKETGLVEYVPDRNILLSANVVASRMNGQDWFLVLNNSNPRAARMAQSINNMDVKGLEGAMRASAYVSRYFASINTQYNITFGPFNFIRDSWGAGLNLSTTKLKGNSLQVLKDGFALIPEIYRILRHERTSGTKATGGDADLWYEYNKEGGSTGTRARFIDPTSKDRDLLEKAVQEMNAGNVKRMAEIATGWVSDYNDTFENAVRFSAYKIALQKGLSKQHAANLAKNLTVNFNRKGSRAQTLGALFAFFNAAVQGTARTLETLRGPNGTKIMVGGFLLGMAQAGWLAMAGYRDDEPPEFVKERNLIILLPGGKYFGIPMPPGFSVFPNLGRIMVEAAYGASQGRDMSKKKFDVLSIVFGALNPLGMTGFSAQTITPTPLDPFMALAQNKDAFDRPIYKADRETNPQVGYERTRDTTWEGWKNIAKFINYATFGTEYQKGAWSPTGDEISFLVGQATGGTGREAMKMFGMAKDFVTGDETPAHKIPLVGKFYGDVESKAATKTRFYNNTTELAKMEREVKGRIKNHENVAEFYKENPAARLINMANSIENEITALNKQRNELIKRGATVEQIKRIEDIKEKKMRMLNERYDKIR